MKTTIRITITEEDPKYTTSYSFPIYCPNWLLWILEKLEIKEGI